MLNCFFNLSSHRSVFLHVRCSTVSSTSVPILVFYYTFDAQLFLQPQFAHYCFITRSMLNCFFCMSAYPTTPVCAHSFSRSLTQWPIVKNFQRCWWRGRSVLKSLSTFVFLSSSLWSTWTNPKRFQLAKPIVTNLCVNGMAGWGRGNTRNYSGERRR